LQYRTTLKQTRIDIVVTSSGRKWARHSSEVSTQSSHEAKFRPNWLENFPQIQP